MCVCVCVCVCERVCVCVCVRCSKVNHNLTGKCAAHIRFKDIYVMKRDTNVIYEITNIYCQY